MKLQVHTIEFRYRVRLPPRSDRSHEQLITPELGIDVQVDTELRLVRLVGKDRDGALWKLYVPLENVAGFWEAPEPPAAPVELPDAAAPRSRKARGGATPAADAG